jgi:hypothetical protein
VPILARAGATVPTGTGHVAPDPRFNDTRRLDFRSLAGDVLTFDSASWIPRAGIEGLHMPPREVVRGQVPGLTGSLLTEIRDVERLVSFPVFVGSDDGHRAHLDQLARLQSFLDFTGVDYAAAGGTFDLVATSASGVRSLRCAYLEGMEGSEGVDSGVWWASFGLRCWRWTRTGMGARGRRGRCGCRRRWDGCRRRTALHGDVAGWDHEQPGDRCEHAGGCDG